MIYEPTFVSFFVIFIGVVELPKKVKFPKEWLLAVWLVCDCEVVVLVAFEGFERTFPAVWFDGVSKTLKEEAW